MDDLLERFSDREAFDRYWKENYVPLCYGDVREAYETFVREADKKIFLGDYEEKGCISREDFIDNLNNTAKFTFQDSLTEAFYEKNPELYEIAFALYETEQMEGRKKGSIAGIFHEEYQRMYREFLLELFDRMIHT